MSKKKYGITAHGRTRVKERTGITQKKDVYNLFRCAIQKGYSPGDLKPPLSTFLKSKQRRGSQIKLYRNMVFIYKYKNLITTYPLPEKYKLYLEIDEKEQKLISEYQSIKIHLLLPQLVSNVSMLISMLQINKSMVVYDEDETFAKLVEIGLKIRVLVLIIKSKLEIKSEEVKVNYTNNLLKLLQSVFEEVESISNKMVESKQARKDLKVEFCFLLNKMVYLINQVELKRFFLTSE